jgi:hypothetical protein
MKTRPSDSTPVIYVIAAQYAKSHERGCMPCWRLRPMGRYVNSPRCPKPFERPSLPDARALN